MSETKWTPIKESTPEVHYAYSQEDGTVPDCINYYYSDHVLLSLERGEMAVGRYQKSLDDAECLLDESWWVESDRKDESGKNIKDYAVLAWRPLPSVI